MHIPNIQFEIERTTNASLDFGCNLQQQKHLRGGISLGLMRRLHRFPGSLSQQSGASSSPTGGRTGGGGLGFPDFAHRRFLDSMQCLYQIAFSMVIHRRFQPFKVWGVGQPETAKFIVCLKCASKRINIRHTHTFRMLGKGTSMVWYILACRDGEIVWDASFFWVDGSLSDGRTFVFKPLLHDNGYRISQPPKAQMKY